MKLHIGGKEVREGWKILNVQKLPGVDFVGDIRDLSQFADRSIDEVYASHVLEHVPLADVTKTLSGIYRVLKRGGKFMVSVPDMDVLGKLVTDPALETQRKLSYMTMIFGGQTDANDYHYFGWNFQFMQYYFDEAGFMEVKRVDSFGLFDDTSEIWAMGVPISLNAVAIK
jgi:predicted SAM-dependent methyltransferase